jgi:hypothetical protein
MVLCLEDAVAILNKWKDDSAHIEIRVGSWLR